MKKAYTLGIILIIALFLFGCSSKEENIGDSLGEIMEPEEPAKMEEVESSEDLPKTFTGGSTKVETGIPKNAIVGEWVNTEDFASETTIFLALDGTGEFSNAESSFEFDYTLVNNKLMMLESTTGNSFTDKNIEKFIGHEGGPLVKDYVYADTTLIIGDLTFTRFE